MGLPALSLGLAGALVAALAPLPYEPPRYRRRGYRGDLKVGRWPGHPEGPCSYRPVGNKRSRRRRAAKRRAASV